METIERNLLHLVQLLIVPNLLPNEHLTTLLKKMILLIPQLTIPILMNNVLLKKSVHTEAKVGNEVMYVSWSW